GIAITGGTFYNPGQNQFPANFVGGYFFADLGQGDIRHLDLQTRAVSEFATGISLPVDLKVDAAGNLYYLERDSSSSRVLRVQFPAGIQSSNPPPATTEPVPLNVSTIGVFDPFTGTWHLRNSNSAGFPDAGNFSYGLSTWDPVVGD